MTGEFSLIRHYFRRDIQTDVASDVILGIGDDCALLAPVAGQLAISVDTLVEGIHFPLDAKPYEIAQRALRTNLSDLAAMGAKPKWFTLALTLPQANEDWLRDFSRGLFNCADEYGIALVGGDTTRGPLTITIQVMGEVPAGVALRRDGAAPDDFIFVTNTLGDGAAALDALTRPNDFSSDAVEYLTQRFYLPEPQIKAGILLRGIASAALDISDGLVADLGHICEASDVGAVIDVANLPFSDALQSVSDINQARDYALCGGDDYQLCFTVSPSKMPELAMLIARGDICATMVGRIERGRGVIAQLDDEPYEISRSGYQHF